MANINLHNIDCMEYMKNIPDKHFEIVIKKILHGDCLELMKEIPDKSIDMILCDLPYGTTSCNWDSVIPFNSLWQEYERICKENAAILLFASQPFSTDLICSNRKLFKYELVWKKNLWSNHVNGKRMPLKAHELILVFYKNQPTFNPQRIEYSESTKKRYKDGDTVGRSTAKSKVYSGFENKNPKKINYKEGRLPGSVLNFKCVHNGNGKRLHPTQKPVELLRNLIRTYSNVGDIILDNCAGSGSTAEAAELEKRQWIVMEKETKYIELIKARMSNLQLKLL